ncbi:MAG: class I SAM-dependent methyltransferase [Fusobacteriaceae bacterium]|nr:class I SAM-dependent methyltransferase [Fusobacteriaceae bacterium]
MDSLSNSRHFFNKMAGKKYGNSDKLDIPILKRIYLKEEENILDIGCGNGRFLEKLSHIQENSYFYGIDLSSNAIELAKKIRNINFSIGESETLNFANNSLDKIFCLNSFHHFPNIEKSLAEMERTLKIGGEIIIGDIWIPPIFRELTNLYLPYSKSGDVKIYSKKDILKLIFPLKLELVSFEILFPTLFILKLKKI